MFSFIVFVCISIQKSWLADRHYGISTFHTLLHLSDRMLDEAALFFFSVFSPTQFFGPKAEHGEHLAPEGLELREGLSRRETSAEGSQKSSARRSE